MTTLESLYQDVETACNTDAGLLRLIQALLEHQPSASPAVKDYVSALVYYALHSRRATIWKQTGRVLLHSPCGINSRYGPVTDLELAKENARACEDRLKLELTPEEIQNIKNRVGRLRLGHLLARIHDSHFEVPR